MAEFERNSEIIVGISYRRAVHYMVYVLKEYNLTDDTLQGIQQHCLNTFPEESDLDTFIENMCTTIRNEHSSFFESVITTLNVDERTAKTVFMEISRRIYENGINWGRILTLYAFAGTFAVYFASKGSMELVEQIPNWIAEIFDSYLAIWMVQNGGWVCKNN